MKIKFLNLVILMSISISVLAQVAINKDDSDPDSSAMLDIKATDAGFLMPRMSQAERNAINLPATGLMIFQTDNTAGYYFYDGSSWSQIGANDIDWIKSGNDMYSGVSGNVGIGTTSPDKKLTVSGNIKATNDVYLLDDLRFTGTNGMWMILNGTTRMRILNNGNVGIGTTSPSAKLDVLSNKKFGIYSDNTKTSKNSVGILGRSRCTQGTGVIGVGNNLSQNAIPTNGTGVCGAGSNTGVFCYSYDSGNNVYGAYFQCLGNSNQYARVEGQFSGVNYKIVGTGSVSTIVKRPDNTIATMFCTEAPEILFQDYGIGELINGRACIKIDSIFSNNIIVTKEHPLKVFIQLEGDCKGVYVTNKTQNSFDVVELQNGNSNVPFSWTIVANRTNDFDRQGNLRSTNIGVRFPDAPEPEKYIMN